MGACKLLLLLLISVTAASALPFTLDEVTHNTTVIPPPSGPQCLPIPTSSQSLMGKRAAIIVGDGSNADAFLVAYEYLKQRSATITVSCAPSSPNLLSNTSYIAMLMRKYYPLYKVSCTAMDNWSVNDYDLIVVPDGYTATLPMRQDVSIQQTLKAFVDPVYSNISSCSIFLVGGSTELLIDSGALSALDCSSQVPIASTPSLASAITNQCQRTTSLPSPTHHLQFGLHNIILGTTTNDLPAMFAHWESVYFNYSLHDLSCNNTNTTQPMRWDVAVTNAGVANVTDGDWITLATATDASFGVLEPSNFSQTSSMCLNGEGVNFCTNALTSLVVAHGSHAREVRSFATVLDMLGTNNLVFCPDSEEENSFGGGYVYLSAEPAYVPTHRLQCTAYYNRTELISSSLVIVAGGVVATHRRLRVDTNLIKAVQSSDTYNLFGSALALLNAVLPTPANLDDVSNAPYYSPTNVDMQLLGFNASAAAVPVMCFRDIHKGATKVLGGYHNASVLEHNLLHFVGQVAGSLVWENAPTGIADPVVLIVVFGLAGIILLGVVIVLCFRERNISTRNARSGTVARDDGLSMKFAA